jgi:SNF2 family DNA or RNA helicase
MGCQFSSNDLEAIQKGYELRDAIAFRLDADLKAPETFVQLKHFEILSWLIANEYLDIKIAVPLKENGFPEDSDRLLDSHHIFHEKVGIFTDNRGDRIVFSGSNNESLSGWESNIESFHVYCSWEGGRDLERVNEETYRFEQLWNDLSPNVRIFEVPEAVKKKLLSYTPANKPNWNREEEINNSIGKISNEQLQLKPRRSAGILPAIDSSAIDKSLPTIDNKPAPNNTILPAFDDRPTAIDNQPNAINGILPAIDNQPTAIEEDNIEEASKMLALQLLANIHQHPGYLDFCLKSIPIQPWSHQLKILRRVAAKFPCSFLIADEVGLGKTIEIGLILRYLIVSQKVKRVLILAPASVQPQWQGELREKFNLHFWSYSQGEFKDPYDRTRSRYSSTNSN